MYRALARFRRLPFQLHYVRRPFSSELHDQSASNSQLFDVEKHDIPNTMPTLLVHLLDQVKDEQSLTQGAIKRSLESVQIHHVRFLLSRIALKDSYGAFLILLPHFIERNLINDKTIVPTIQALTKAWIQQGPTKKIKSLAKKLEPFLPDNNISKDLRFLLDICEDKWPVSFTDLDQFFVFKHECVEALAVAALRHLDFKFFKHVTQQCLSNQLFKDQDVLNVLVGFAKSSRLLLGTYLSYMEGQIISSEKFEQIKQVFNATKGGRITASKVVDGKCIVCGEELKERLLTGDEFDKLASTFSDHLFKECNHGRIGSKIEFYSMQKMLAEIKRRPNCKSFVVVDGLNVNAGRLQEIPGILDRLRALKQKYDAVLIVMRVSILTDRMKMLKQDGIDFFTLNKNSKDDWFMLYAALQLGQNTHIISNDRYTDIVHSFNQETDVANLLSIWLKNQAIGHTLPLQLHEINRFSNLLQYSPDKKSCHFVVFYDNHGSSRKLICLKH